MSSDNHDNTPPGGEGRHGSQAHAFQRSTIHNLGSINNTVHQYGNAPQESEGERGRKMLSELACPDATFSSDVAPTQLDEDTCQAIIRHIISWVENRRRQKNLFWLHGGVGIGKSAVLERVAGELNSEESRSQAKEACRFFFHSGDSPSETLLKFVHTLAYRLALNIKGLRQAVFKAVEDDTTLLKADLDMQWQKLVIGPVKQMARTMPPAVIIIDGLDRCEGEANQEKVLKLISACGSNFPIAFLVTTRSQGTIYYGVKKKLLELCLSPLDLDTWIKERHLIKSDLEEIFMRHRQVDPQKDPWPTDDVVNRVTTAANGNKAWTTLLFKYIDQDKPVKRLEDFLKNLPDRPSNVDNIYHHIIRSLCPPNDPRNQELLFLLCTDALEGMTKSIQELGLVLDLEFGECHSRLKGLHPIIEVPSETGKEIRMPDSSVANVSRLIFDNKRDLGCYVDKKMCAASIVERCLLKLKTKAHQSTPDRILTLCWWNCSKFLEHPEDVPKSLMQKTQEVDFDSFLERLSSAFLYDRFSTYFHQYRNFGSTRQCWGNNSLTSQYSERAMEHAIFARWLTLHYSCLLKGHNDCPLPSINRVLEKCNYPNDESQLLSWTGLLTLVRARDKYTLPPHDGYGSWTVRLEADDLVCASLTVFKEERWFKALSRHEKDIEHLNTWSRPWSFLHWSQEKQDEGKRLRQKIAVLLRQLPQQHHNHQLNKDNVISWLKGAFSDQDRPKDLLAHWESEECSSMLVEDDKVSDEGDPSPPEDDMKVQVETSTSQALNDSVHQSEGNVSGPKNGLEVVEEREKTEESTQAASEPSIIPPISSPMLGDARTFVPLKQVEMGFAQVEEEVAQVKRPTQMNPGPSNCGAVPMNVILPWIGFGIAVAVVLIQWWQMLRGGSEGFTIVCFGLCYYSNSTVPLL